jgi:DNA-binding ferritin-like protein (Dps family)
MRKFNKIVSTLLLGLMVAGCDVEALPKDYEETYGAIDMQDVYDSVRNSQGEAAIYNQVINTIAEKEITAAGRTQELYSRIQEKIDDLIEDSYTDVDYDLYPADGYKTIEEDKLRTYHLSQGYKLSDGNSTSNVWNAEKVLTGEATNTYVSEKLKTEVLTSMLNEQFIHDRKANSLYKTKQLRQIEYVYVDFNAETDDYNDIVKFEEDLRNGVITDLTEIEDAWKAHKKDVILENAKKAGDPELDEDNKYYTEFTGCGDSVRVCANQKMYNVDETEYYTEPKIYTKTDSPLLSAMTDTLFSSTFDYEDENVFKVESNGTTYYYLKAQSDVELNTDSLINVDTNSNKYYFVRFAIVANGNPTDSSTDYTGIVTEYKGQTVPYAIAQTLAKTASNYSNCIIFYLNKYNLAINDDKFFEYVYDTYGYPEEDEK